ncbi:MAG: hypothetical protein ISP49_19470 [Reyranella sp.]|nr:hypothetical protein [Reyranella sp.]MBL6653784.1 hypothetical protein [Reyranella sp.]
MTLTPVAGRPALLLGAYDLAPLGYQAEEFFLEGSVSRYAPAGSAAYKTRIVVIRPTDPATFNGTLLVEWLNVTSGQDMPSDWFIAHREIVRRRYAYAAVSAQPVGIEGGGSVMGIGAPLKTLDAPRYGSLSHPGDAFAYDIFAQAGAALRALLKPQRLVAMGQSQSAMFLTTYVNAVDALTPVYDGFFVHSRFGPAGRLDGLPVDSPDTPTEVRFRADLRVPVLALITETDLLGARLPGYQAARRPDDAHLRVWELAGSSHADSYLFAGAFADNGTLPPERLADLFWPRDSVAGAKLAKPYNPGLPHHYVAQAAIAALDRWLRTGEPPASTALLEARTDARGISVGGIRTPWTDASTMRLAGAGNSGGFLGQLAGIGEPFDKATLAKLYPGGKDDYLQRFTAALDRTIAAGHLLLEDRAEILAIAAIHYDKAP